MPRRWYRNPMSPAHTSQGQRERPLFQELSSDVAIRRQYDQRVALLEPLGNFGTVVRKSTEKYEEAVRVCQIHMEATESARNTNNIADEKEAYENALKSCTEALAFAGQNELAQGYYHRAVVLHRMNEDVIALSDIYYALSSLHDASDEALKTEIENLKQTVLNSLHIKADEVLRPLRLKNEGQDSSSVPLVSLFRPGNIPDINYAWMKPDNESLALKKTKFLPDASKKIKPIEVMELLTRVKAVENVDPGECLMSLEPYATMLSTDCFRTHCSHCSLLCLHLLPCPTCSLVMFCCESCRDEAYKQYHKTECQYLNHLIEMKTERETLLALRVVLKLSSQGDDIRLKSLMLNELYKEPFIERPMFIGDEIDPNDTTTLGRIADNFWRMDGNLQRRLINTVVDLINLLKKTTSLFHDDPSTSHSSSITQLLEVPPDPHRALGNERNPSENEGSIISPTHKIRFIGRLLLKFLCVVRSCSHSIRGSKKMFSMKSKLCLTGSDDIGIGFYSCLNPNFIEQSCNPNVLPVYFKNRVLLYSTQKIKKGSMISYSFAEPYWSVAQGTRIEKLNRVSPVIRCLCDACEKHWPTEDSLPADYPEYRKKRGSHS